MMYGVEGDRAAGIHQSGLIWAWIGVKWHPLFVILECCRHLVVFAGALRPAGAQCSMLTKGQGLAPQRTSSSQPAKPRSIGQLEDWPGAVPQWARTRSGGFDSNQCESSNWAADSDLSKALDWPEDRCSLAARAGASAL